jgi:hypothetical protein
MLGTGTRQLMTRTGLVPGAFTSAPTCTLPATPPFGIAMMVPAYGEGSVPVVTVTWPQVAPAAQ